MENMPTDTISPQMAEPEPTKRKRPRLKLIFFAVVIFVTLIALMLGTVFVLNFLGNGENGESNGTENGVQIPKDENNQNGTPQEIVTQYINNEHEFTINYLEENDFSKNQIDERLTQYQITFDGENQTKTINEIDDVEDGYLVQINHHTNVISQDTDAITLEKRNSYIIRCEDTASFSNIEDTQISGVVGKTFEIENCQAKSFVQTFVVRDGDLYEFIQVFKGDVGIRQVYKNKTSEIVDLFEFTNVIAVAPKEQWATHESSTYKFSYRYPAELDTLCCTINGPIDDNVQKIGVYVDPRSIQNVDRRLFNGFGVFIGRNLEEIPFDTYVENQKALLEENFRVVTGRPTAGEQTQDLQIGGQQAIKLINYAWWGEVIYVNIPERNEILVFSITELNDGILDTILNDVLNSLEFEQQ